MHFRIRHLFPLTILALVGCPIFFSGARITKAVSQRTSVANVNFVGVFPLTAPAPGKGTFNGITED
jgi:hypothetical protein